MTPAERKARMIQLAQRIEKARRDSKAYGTGVPNLIDGFELAEHVLTYFEAENKP